MPGDPILEMEPEPFLKVVRQPDDAPIPIEELGGRRPVQPAKAIPLSLFLSRYDFEETTAAQQAKMLTIIKSKCIGQISAP
jgi:hypothetical protein